MVFPDYYEVNSNGKITKLVRRHNFKKVKLYNINYDTGEYKHDLDNFNLNPGGVPDGEALDYYFFDEAMYIGRIQINLNNGKKRKFLYFQADYKIRK